MRFIIYIQYYQKIKKVAFYMNFGMEGTDIFIEN